MRIDPGTGVVKDVADITSGLAGMDFGADGSIFIANYFDGDTAGAVFQAATG